MECSMTGPPVSGRFGSMGALPSSTIRKRQSGRPCLRAMREVPVHYCLALSDIAPVLVRLTNETPQSQRWEGARVLIVEDERVVARNLELQLSDLGYHVVASVASSGEAALGVFLTASPDIVLMDINLETAMRGTEAGRILWERHRVPIVYLTAYTDEKTLNEATASMPYGFIDKPYRPAQFHAAIRLALDPLGPGDGAYPSARSRRGNRTDTLVPPPDSKRTDP